MHHRIHSILLLHLQELAEYEENPNQYTKKVHEWFSPENAEVERAKVKQHWSTMYYLQVTLHRNDTIPR